MAERALPDSVRGPVDFCALRKLARSWASERILLRSRGDCFSVFLSVGLDIFCSLSGKAGWGFLIEEVAEGACKIMTDPARLTENKQNTSSVRL